MAVTCTSSNFINWDAFCLPRPPTPTTAMFTLSLGAMNPVPPSTCLGTIVNAAVEIAIDFTNFLRPEEFSLCDVTVMILMVAVLQCSIRPSQFLAAACERIARQTMQVLKQCLGNKARSGVSRLADRQQDFMLVSGRGNAAEQGCQPLKRVRLQVGHVRIHRLLWLLSGMPGLQFPLPPVWIRHESIVDFFICIKPDMIRSL